MRIATTLGFVLSIGVAATLLANPVTAGMRAAANVLPSGTHKPPQRSRSTSWMKPIGAQMSLVYVSDVAFGAVIVFDSDGTVEGQIGGLSDPEGLFVDSGHNLWVANAGDSDILEFARGATSPSKVLTDRGGSPSDVTICPNGSVYASNTFQSRGRGGDILVYAAGSTSPTSSLHFPTEFQNYFVTCDRAGNVFSTLTLNPGGGTVIEYPAARQARAIELPIALSNFPGGIKQDNAGNLLIADQLGFAVTEYTEAGSPTGISIKSPNQYTVPVDIAVAKSGKAIGVALFDVRSGGGSKGQTYTFPGSRPKRSYDDSFDKPIGFAFDPGRKTR